jgi:hypothetical protein
MANVSNLDGVWKRLGKLVRGGGKRMRENRKQQGKPNLGIVNMGILKTSATSILQFPLLIVIFPPLSQISKNAI